MTNCESLLDPISQERSKNRVGGGGFNICIGVSTPSIKQDIPGTVKKLDEKLQKWKVEQDMSCYNNRRCAQLTELL
jgi:hypothetical protein